MIAASTVLHTACPAALDGPIAADVRIPGYLDYLRRGKPVTAAPPASAGGGDTALDGGSSEI